jgi:hypothetical protein
MLELPQTFDPRTISVVTVFAKKPTGAEIPSIVAVFFQARSDTVRQSFLDFRKLILALVLLVVLLGVLLHPFLVLECIVVVVDAHEAIERIGQGPVESRSKPRRFRLERFDGRPDLEIAGATADHCDGKLSISHNLIEAFAVGDIADFEVVLDVALQQVPAVFTDGPHDGVFGEDEDALAALLPAFTGSETFPHECSAQVIHQLSPELMAVLGREPGQGRERLRKRRGQKRYARGGSNSVGAASDWLWFGLYWSMASDTNRASAMDSLH